MNDYFNRHYEVTKENENSKYYFVDGEYYHKLTFATFCFCLSFINIIVGIFLAIYFYGLIGLASAFIGAFIFFAFGIIAKKLDNIDEKLDEIKLQIKNLNKE